MGADICIIIKSPPYGSVMPAEAFRSVQALQTFERDVSVLFMSDGVLTIVDATDPEPIGMHRLAGAFVDLFVLPGVTFTVHDGSLVERGLERDDLAALPGGNEYTFLGTDQIEPFIADHRTVMCF
jgi:sulfur relay (sulfurtransferase) DsrF/TusC family protein